VKKNWGDGDDWLDQRQKKEELRKDQKVCLWLLEKSFSILFCMAVLSFALTSLLPIYLFLGVAAIAFVYLWVN